MRCNAFAHQFSLLVYIYKAVCAVCVCVCVCVHCAVVHVCVCVCVCIGVHGCVFVYFQDLALCRSFLSVSYVTFPVSC